MIELVTLSKALKSHRLFSSQRDSIYALYKELSQQQRLSAEQLLQSLQALFPEIARDLTESSSLLQHLQDDITDLRKRGVSFVCLGEALYPPLCYRMEDPPLVLSYVGAPAWIEKNTLAVVGSREAQPDSLVWMEKELGLFCERQRPCIVSGGARGVDQKAHGVALRKGCKTIVVLPSGLGEVYPSSLQDWIPAIVDAGGCVVSEYDHRQKMHKHLFHHRNRLIAALGQASLLVEARRRSGTLITAQQALLLGRAVWVVPGHPLDTHFQGSLDLLLDGAALIRDAEDLLMLFSAEIHGGEMSPVSMGARLGIEHYP